MKKKVKSDVVYLVIRANKLASSLTTHLREIPDQVNAGKLDHWHRSLITKKRHYDEIANGTT